jgi:hypothetical protein
MSCYVVWKFAETRRRPAVPAGLVDNFASVFRESEFYNLPCYPATVPDLAAQLATTRRRSPGQVRRALLGPRLVHERRLPGLRHRRASTRSSTPSSSPRCSRAWPATKPRPRTRSGPRRPRSRASSSGANRARMTRAPWLSFEDHFSRQAADYARYRPDYPRPSSSFSRGSPPTAAARGTARRQRAGRARPRGHFEAVVATDASVRQIREAARRDASPLRGRRGRRGRRSPERPSGSSRSRRRSTGSIAPDSGARSGGCSSGRRGRGVVRTTVSRHTRSRSGDSTVLQGDRRPILAPGAASWSRVRRARVSLSPRRRRPRSSRKALGPRRAPGLPRTWSASQRFQEAKGSDPVLLVREDLAEAWGPPERIRPFRWDLDLRVGRQGRGRRIDFLP